MSAKETPTTVVTDGYTLHIRSVAGIETLCYVDNVDIAFDMGCCAGKAHAKSHVFITHGHVDHINAFVTHAARRNLNKMKPAKYYLPIHLKTQVEIIMDSFSLIHGNRIPATFVGVVHGDEIDISSDWMVKAIATDHRVPSLGYVLYRKKTKLKDEYIGIPGDEIAKLRRNGVSITLETKTPEIAYTGDTTIQSFLFPEPFRLNEFLNARILVTECTYMDHNTTADKATERGHIHLDQIIAKADLFANVSTLVLMHFSARYFSLDIEQEVMKKLPTCLKQKVKIIQ